ncbi:MAG: DUF443 domain-containing protein [Bacteroidetes bacterium]|nr:DUF443 domain-containing protein [Bacteroidota bacterium]
MKSINKFLETGLFGYLLIFCGLLISLLILADYFEMPTTYLILSIFLVILFLFMAILYFVRSRRVKKKTGSKILLQPVYDEGKKILLDGFNEKRKFRERNITREESAFLMNSFSDNSKLIETKPLMNERETLLVNISDPINNETPEKSLIVNKVKQRPPSYKDIQDAKKLSLYYEFTGELFDLFNRLDVEQVEKITKQFNKGIKEKFWLNEK